MRTRLTKSKWIFRFIAAPAEGDGNNRAGWLLWKVPPGSSAVCSLQTALRLRPRRALSSAEAAKLHSQSLASATINYQIVQYPTFARTLSGFARTVSPVLLAPRQVKSKFQN